VRENGAHVTEHGGQTRREGPDLSVEAKRVFVTESFDECVDLEVHGTGLRLEEIFDGISGQENGLYPSWNDGICRVRCMSEAYCPVYNEFHYAF
jgi:hypothetical protein